MAQTITPNLEALLIDKLQVGDKKHRGEIEIDYVVAGFTSIGDPADILAAFGTVTADHAGASSAQTPTNPQYANDGNGATYSEYLAGGQGSPAPIPERWLEGDLGAPYEITHFVVKWLSDFGNLQTDLFEAGTGPNGRLPYVRFLYYDGAVWIEATGSITTDDLNTPETFTFTFTAPITAQLWRLYAAGRNNGNLWPGYRIYTWGIWGAPGSVVEATVETATYQVASLGLDRSRKMAAAQLDALLDNEDGTRGYYALGQVTFIPNNPVRAYTWYGDRANRVRVFTGLFDRANEHRNPQTISMKARSRMKWLLEQSFQATAPQGVDEAGAVRTEANGVYLSKTIAYIVGDILTRAGWPAADRVIAPPAITLSEYDLADKASWADQIAGADRLTTASGCDFWEDELGVIHFEPSPLIAAVEPTAAWEFVAGVNVLALDHEVDDEDRATRVEVSGPMTSTVAKWSQVWQTTILRYPAGIWYDPADSAYIRVIDRVTKYIYRIKQSDRSIASKKYLGGYPLGLSGIPGDATHYLVLNAPWRNTGTTSGNSIKKYLKADDSLVATYSLPNGRWTAMKSDGTNIWLTNYDDGKLYKRSMTATAVANYTISYGGVTQTGPTGLWINGTTIGIFFSGYKRFLLVSSAAPGTVTGSQSTAGTRIAGGEADTDTDIDLYADADAGSFGSTTGYIWKFTLAELVTKDVTALAVDWNLEDALGFQSGIANRTHDGCPNIVGAHKFEIRQGDYAMKVVQSLAQAGDVAAAQLSLLTRLRRVLDIATIGHPGVQANDPVRYADAIAGIDATWIVDSYRASISGSGTYTQSMSVLPWEAP